MQDSEMKLRNRSHTTNINPLHILIIIDVILEIIGLIFYPTQPNTFSMKLIVSGYS